jgi:hypothetical protein
VLAYQHITVLDDPRGVLEVDSSSIVIATDLPEIRDVIADIANPAVMIQALDKAATSV